MDSNPVGNSDETGNPVNPGVPEMTIFGQRPETRAADSDREGVAEILKRAHGEGRITPEELSDRLVDTYRALTFGDLAIVVADLPLKNLASVGPANSVSDLELVGPKPGGRSLYVHHRVRVVLIANLASVGIWLLTSAHTHGSFWPGWVMLASGLSLTGGIRKIRRNS